MLHYQTLWRRESLTIAHPFNFSKKIKGMCFYVFYPAPPKRTTRSNPAAQLGFASVSY